MRGRRVKVQYVEAGLPELSPQNFSVYFEVRVQSTLGAKSTEQVSCMSTIHIEHYPSFYNGGAWAMQAADISFLGVVSGEWAQLV